MEREYLNREEFCARVLKKVRHATVKERAAIRAELEGHLEDHAAALGSAGCGEAEAMERALAAMGDPEEIGAGLDRDYPLGWLALSRVSTIVTVLLCASLIFTYPQLEIIANSLQARVAPQTSRYAEEMEHGEQYGEYYENFYDDDTCQREVDVRGSAGGEVLRVYKVALKAAPDGSAGTVCLFACNYDQNPFGYAAGGFRPTSKTSISNQNRTYGGYVGGNDGAYYRAMNAIPVAREDEVVTVTCGWYGETLELEVPVPWEDVK